MNLFPAIDLRQGRVVRLSQGESTRQTAYGDDPVAVAIAFAEAGARWIHVVDLDRAFGEGDNAGVISRLAQEVGGRLQVQVGGGIRDMARLTELIDLPIARLVLGTAAIADVAFVADALAIAGPDRIAVGVDVRDGVVAVRGWRESSGETAVAVTRRMVAAGVRTLIHTDIARDGMLTGPDVDGARALQAEGVEVIASGGVGTLDHLRAVAAAGLAGAIVGRALYEQRFTLAEALSAIDT